MAIGRNDPCPCGSGQKYKHCCEAARHSPLSPGLVILVVIVLVGAVAAVMAIVDARDLPPQQQVWSEEHGHWHTVSNDAGTDPVAGTPTPPPPGPAPPGKIWSSEHGHWHDAP